MVLTKEMLQELLTMCNKNNYCAIAFSSNGTVFYRKDGETIWRNALGYESNPFPTCKAS